MVGATRTTIYFQPKVYRALKIKAVASDRSLSELVNAAVRAALREDGLDLEAFERRRTQPSRPFGRVLDDLRRDGLL